MAKLTLAQLERHLLSAADILRGTMDVTEYRDHLFALLFLKWVNDEFEAAREQIAQDAASGPKPSGERVEDLLEQEAEYRSRGVLFVPGPARWSRIAFGTHHIADKVLRPAFHALEDRHRELTGLSDHPDFTRIGGTGTGDSRARRTDQRLRQLIQHFDRIRLRTADFEFPDLPGVAFEHLIRHFAETSGSRGGEFYTPREVVRLMVELLRPRPGMRIYDPCVGSGGVLVHVKEYVKEYGGNTTDLFLAGEDVNSSSRFTAMINLLLHGVQDFELLTGDALGRPAHLPQTDRDRFDGVLSKPPFSVDYVLEDFLAAGAERAAYGVTKGSGRADLMFLQHMLATAKQEGDGGTVIAVMPHGVLFRGGSEQEIRTNLLNADVIEAVIGLASNLFPSTGIPACLLVLRPPGKKPPARAGRVLFINAEREYRAERARNTLLPEHIEKITATFHRYQQVPGFSRIVGRDELRANGDNLNIRRYVDTAPPPEPQHVRAYLGGGMPRAEIDAKRDLLDACGVRVTDLFAERNPVDPGYLDFLPKPERPDADRLAELVRPREEELWAALRQWWETEAVHRLEAEAGQRRAAPMSVRSALITSFTDRLGRVGLLDGFALAGALAGWWHDGKYEFLTLSQHGFAGVLDGWVQQIEAQLRPEQQPGAGRTRSRTAAERRQAYAHKVVAAIASSFLDELREADSRKGELDARWSELNAGTEEHEEDTPPDGDPAVVAALSRVKRDRMRVSRAIRHLETGFLDGLFATRAELSDQPGAERRVVLDVLHEDLVRKLDVHVARRRRELIEAYRRWEDEYAVSLRDIRAERAEAARSLEVLLGRLGYR
ncbi:class I SAM-dependent DNA methyltransferase [Streptomyces sp. YIM 98790]|uniref:type I restriction-modification system subunit M n=1 Tax=Streptomyces sp. YIM 98790 TaxID=2689077 RepID=UPI00140B69AE|nr:class I SAM-dependent DNA methyltransferase [Streptomyces sp. YIM 98790]